jgi:hypothetical protein
VPQDGARVYILYTSIRYLNFINLYTTLLSLPTSHYLSHLYINMHLDLTLTLPCHQLVLSFTH